VQFSPVQSDLRGGAHGTADWGIEIVLGPALPAVLRALVFCVVTALLFAGAEVAQATTGLAPPSREPVVSPPMLQGQLALVVSLALVSGNIVGVTMSALMRRHYGVELGWPSGELLLHIAAVLSGVLTLVFALAALGPLSTHPWEAQLSAWGPVLGKAALASLIIVTGNVVMAWISPERGLLAKLKETAVLCSLAWLLAHTLEAGRVSLAFATP
jgi:hypothetical protein